jgi:GcrA cell cycle regulator
MTGKRRGEWPEERIAALRALHAEGLPLSEIGRRLGVSKNAVNAKADREGLPARPNPVQRRAEPRPARTKPLRRGTSTLPPLSSEEHTDA